MPGDHNAIRGAAWFKFGRSLELESRGCILPLNPAEYSIYIKMLDGKTVPKTGKIMRPDYFFGRFEYGAESLEFYGYRTC